MSPSVWGALTSLIALAIGFTVSLSFAVHYWREAHQPRIGQSKKRRMRKVMWRWTWASIFTASIGITGAVIYYLAPAAMLIQPSEKPYVFIKDSVMEDLTAGKPPAVRFIVQNGPVESVVTFTNVSFVLTRFIPEKYLKYVPGGEPQKFKVAPRQTMTVKWEAPDSLVLTQNDIDELKATKPTAELYIFARGEYSNETGKHPLNLCQMFYDNFPGHLVFCRDDVKIE